MNIKTRTEVVYKNKEPHKIDIKISIDSKQHDFLYLINKNGKAEEDNHLLPTLMIDNNSGTGLAKVNMTSEKLEEITIAKKKAQDIVKERGFELE